VERQELLVEELLVTEAIVVHLDLRQSAEVLAVITTDLLA
jgi:hypothetical protein